MAPNLAANPYWALDQQVGKQFGISPDLLSAQQYEESGWNPAAVSPAGAFGLTQFIPSTAAAFGVEPGTSTTAVTSQVEGEAKYLSQLYTEEGSWTGALEAYNAGPGGVANAAANGAAGYATNILSMAGDPGGAPTATATGSSPSATPAQTTSIISDITNPVASVVSGAAGAVLGPIVPGVERFLLSLVFVAAAAGLVILGATRLFPGFTRTVGSAARLAA